MIFSCSRQVTSPTVYTRQENSVRQGQPLQLPRAVPLPVALPRPQIQSPGTTVSEFKLIADETLKTVQQNRPIGQRKTLARMDSIACTTHRRWSFSTHVFCNCPIVPTMVCFVSLLHSCFRSALHNSHHRCSSKDGCSTFQQRASQISHIYVVDGTLASQTNPASLRTPFSGLLPRKKQCPDIGGPPRHETTDVATSGAPTQEPSTTNFTHVVPSQH